MASRCGSLGSSATTCFTVGASLLAFFGGTIDEPTISLDEQLAQSTVETLFIDYGGGDEPTFTVDPAGNVRIVGSSPGAVCTLDTPERILAGMEAGERLVELRPREDPDVRGIEWAKSLGIVG